MTYHRHAIPALLASASIAALLALVIGCGGATEADSLPVALPATPVQVTEADLDDTFGDHHRDDPISAAQGRCEEDEVMVAYPNFDLCLHIMGEGWRVLPEG